MLTDIKNELDRFRDYEIKKREPEYNASIANINNKLAEL
jgi:hypothetical protein